ncbi:putative LRR receptor serine/threonine-protein kinase [Trifolium repens]|nr:putative LRR receptor serine/threonine-protein kinase [Trifolium repens]
MIPSNWFSSIAKRVKPTRLPISKGIFPDIILPPRYSSLSWVDKLPMKFGKLPPKLLLDIESVSSLLQFVKDFKNSKSLLELFPKLFSSILRKYKSFSFPRFGTCPTKLLAAISNSSMEEDAFMEVGIGPEN